MNINTENKFEILTLDEQEKNGKTAYTAEIFAKVANKILSNIPNEFYENIKEITVIITVNILNLQFGTITGILNDILKVKIYEEDGYLKALAYHPENGMEFELV